MKKNLFHLHYYETKFRIILKNALIMLMLFEPIYSLNELNVNLKTCKITHAGISFGGDIGRTLQGFRCLRWDSLGKYNLSFKDEDFPDGSVRKAKNFCRNPTRDRYGPWCYAGSPPVQQLCGVPLCASACRLSGPGAEYAGTISRPNYRHCEKWNNIRNERYVKLRNGSLTHGCAYSDDKFPDKDVESAYNYCRNPEGSLGGPWCYVFNDARGVYDKSYCDVPVCDERDHEFVSKQKDFYSHFISSAGSELNITFAVRLWDPDREHNATIKILLSALNVPTSRQNIRKWGTAVELSISNSGTGITLGNNNQFLESTPDILKAWHYTSFVILWKNNDLYLYKSSDASESVYVGTLANPPFIGHKDLTIKHFSMSGDVAMWAFPLGDDDTCQEHTTFLPLPLFTWKLHQDGVLFYLELSFRTFHSALIFLTCNPYHEYPRFSIKIGYPESEASVTTVVYELTEKVHSRIATTNFPVDYWSWTRLRIVVLGKELRVMRHGEGNGNFVPLFILTHQAVSCLRWFSIGSNRSLTHWVLLCEPSDLPTAYPPNCAITNGAADYKGDQWVTYSGLPCLPWFAVEPNNDEDSLKLNYCRNVKGLRPAPWCYVDTSSGIKPKICHVRKCNAIVCKKAGTANDYVGDLSVTRSNRTCKRWPRNFINHKKRELYPGTFFEGNYCRNPTREVGGAWCFTTDSNLKKDLCLVRDCDKIESRIVITNHNGDLRYIYVIPKWRDPGANGGLKFSLKRWDPTLPEGVLFKIFSENKSKFFTLYIGAENNEELILRYSDKKLNANVLLVRKIFPHIIPGGNWREFRLQMPTGRIRLGYETKDFAILDWTADKPHMMFNPAFISYESIGHDVVGLYFPDLDCHVENTSALFHSRIYPISWQKDDDFSYNLTLYIRGSGTAIIPLVHFPSQTEDYLVVFIDARKKQISLRNNTILNTTHLCTEEVGDSLISHSEWSRYDIFSMNNSLYVLRNKIQLLRWDSPVALVYYFFSVSAQLGWMMWAANCRPPHVDSTRRDGHWSSWSDWYCSVTCGKGVGYRRRKCDNPTPNIFGNPCYGLSEETGICNDFECGHISPRSYNLIQKYLQTKTFNIIAKEGSNITFKAPVQLITHIKAESPSSEIIWMHEGMVLEPIKEKHFISDFLSVVTTNITQYDDGVYECVVKSNTSINYPLKVVVVAVEPARPDIIVSNGSCLQLTCASALQTMYADLWIKWYHNDELYASTDIATIYFNNTLRIPVALMNHTGMWKCIMEQTDLNLRWVVKIHYLIVNLEPSLLSIPLEIFASLLTLNLMQCDNRILNYVTATVLLIFTCIIVFSILICVYHKNAKKVAYKTISDTDLSHDGGNNNISNGKPDGTVTENKPMEEMTIDVTCPRQSQHTDSINIHTKVGKINISEIELQETVTDYDFPSEPKSNNDVPTSPGRAKLKVDSNKPTTINIKPIIEYKRENKFQMIPKGPQKNIGFPNPNNYMSPCKKKQKPNDFSAKTKKIDTTRIKILPAEQSGPKKFGIKFEFLKNPTLHTPELECPVLRYKKVETNISSEDLLPKECVTAHKSSQKSIKPEIINNKLVDENSTNQNLKTKSMHSITNDIESEKANNQSTNAREAAHSHDDDEATQRSNYEEYCTDSTQEQYNTAPICTDSTCAYRRYCY